MSSGSPTDRAAFAQRVRRQVEARYRGTTVEVDQERHSLRLHGGGIDLVLPLAALHAACDREPARTSSLVADFVRSVEGRMAQRAADVVAPGRVLWCVRTRQYLRGLARSADLLSLPVGADIVAFVAESLPGQVMRGVPREEWERAGLDDTAIRHAVDENTARRFARLLDRVAAIERIPADGWRLAGDPLYQGSIVMVPALLRALVARSGGDVLIGLPDRAVALVLPAALPAAETFGRRVLQEWREAMNPCSREVLRSDGDRLEVVGHARRQPSLLPWLND